MYSFKKTDDDDEDAYKLMWTVKLSEQLSEHAWLLKYL